MTNKHLESTLVDFAHQWGSDHYRSEDNETLKDRFWADLARHGYTIGGNVGGKVFDFLWQAATLGRDQKQSDMNIAKDLREGGKRGFCPYVRRELFACVVMEKRMSRMRARSLLATVAALGAK